jgi:hypothetical protein
VQTDRSGPLMSGHIGRTPVSGSFELRGASLGQYRGLAGILNGNGRFSGALESIAIHGAASVSQFAVNDNSHPVELQSEYRTTVNGLSGDVLLESVEADFLQTHLDVSGTIQSRTGERGKTVSLDFTGEEARIEDLLRLFTTADRPARAGPMGLRAHVELPPGSEKFLRRLQLNGDFGIEDARWTRSRTQTKINELSVRARGEKDQLGDKGQPPLPPVVSDLKGSVSMRNGLVVLRGLSFRVPGAIATGNGTFDVTTKQVDLQGTVSMAADVSEAASGFKSILLKPFNRFFRRNKKQKGATLPVSVTGQYPRPRYRIRLTK